MLRELRIRDFAIIDDLQLQFASAFNVLTGETGAGKSIIMRALVLLCGGRAATDDIRAGRDEAVIEGVFDLEADETRNLAELGMESANDLHIRRTLGRTGKSRVFVNGSSASVALLDQIGARLIHVYGQHEQSLLLRPESHLELLDTYAAHAELTAAMAERFDVLQRLRERLDRLRGGREQARQRLELISFQLQELEMAAIRPGEDEELRRQKEVMANAEKLLQFCTQGEASLYSGDDALAPGLGRVASQLREAARIDPVLSEVIDLLASAEAQAQEAAARLRSYGEHVSFDPEQREAVEERWTLLQKLIRKYGGSLEALLLTQADLQQELRSMEGDNVDLETLEKEAEVAGEAARQAAALLSASRKQHARQLEKEITRELQLLGMKGGTFSVVFGERDGSQTADAIRTGLSRDGSDEIEFHFSANRGEPPRPLARVASGGELSRIMLALKVLTAGRGDVGTLVFDEVDAGIGGGVADAVGARLKQLGQSRQILCITHLPQVAASADHHFVVEKHLRQRRTLSAARQLEREERIAELSRMLGGADDAEASRYARRLVSTHGETHRATSGRASR